MEHHAEQLAWVVFNNNEQISQGRENFMIIVLGYFCVVLAAAAAALHGVPFILSFLFHSSIRFIQFDYYNHIKSVLVLIAYIASNQISNYKKARF